MGIDQSGFEHSADCDAWSKTRLLLDIRDACALANGHVAGVRIFLPCKNLEQGAFACAIRADQPDAVAVGDRERDVTKQRSRAKGLGYTLRI